MRRVLTGLLLPALLSLLLIVPATAAAAEPVTIHSTDAILLATEGGGPLPGPTPQDPNASENFGAPPEYEAPFLWKASLGLLALVVGIVGLLGGLYYLLVLRPRRDASTTA
jgi:hypothetical protein